MKNIIYQAIDLTQRLVAIASESSDPISPHPSGAEQGIVACLQEICREYEVPWRVQEALPGRYNFIAFFPQENAPKLLILAHMDTVSAKGMESPFAATLANGRIYGRGACDDKGPMAMALSTLLGLSRKQNLRYDVTFVATVDEECSMSGAAHFAKECEEYDLCLAMEPTGLRLVNAHKGVYRGQITCKGTATHSSTPELGDNAIMTMHAIISDLKKFALDLETTSDPNLGQATFAITQISGGTVINIIPDICKIAFDIRLLPEHTTKSVASSLQALIGERGKIRKIFATPAIHSDPGNEYISRFLQSIALEKIDASPTTASYATDCSKLIKKGPCIVWGPGHIEQAHQREEFIDMSQIDKGCRILAHFLGSTID